MYILHSCAVLFILVIFVAFIFIYKYSLGKKLTNETGFHPIIDKFSEIFDVVDSESCNVRSDVYSPYQRIITPGGQNVLLTTSCHNMDVNEYLSKILKIRRSEYIIFYDGEPSYPKDELLGAVDFIITTKLDLYEKYKDKSIHLPYLSVHLYKLGIGLGSVPRTLGDINGDRSKFCFFAYTNTDEGLEGVRARKKFYYLMQEITRGRVSNHGKSYGGVPLGTYTDNSKILKDYKFTISIENSFIPGYITEKLINPFLAGSIPIYLGAPDVSKYFNKKAFIDVRDFDTFEECIDYVVRVDKDSELYDSYMKENIFNEEKSKELENLISSISGGTFYRELERKMGLKDFVKSKLFNDERNNT